MLVAFTEFERTACEIEVRRYVETRRPPEHLRSKLDIDFSIADQAIEIFWGKASLIKTRGDYT